MLKILIALSLFSFSNAALAADSGLACNMAYSTSGPLSTSTDINGGWLADGSELAGKAVVYDGDGEHHTATPAHYIAASKKGNMWTVQILGGEKSLLGSFTFLQEKGMKVSLPVRAYANESEDPQQYDTLEVSCHFTIFAG